MTTKEWESVLNIELSHIFRRLGLNCRPEVIHPGNRRIDVEVKIGPVVIAVEAEHGQSAAKRTEAIGDADRRLEQKLAQCAVAVCYPDETTEKTLPSSEVIYTVRDGTRTSANWNTGDIDRLASIIRLAPAQLGDPDAAAAALSSSLDGAVRKLSDQQKESLAKALDLPRQTKDGKPVAQPWNAPAKRALLVVATAVMFHSRLDVHLKDMRPTLDNRQNPPGPFTGDWPPTPAQICLDSSAPIQAYRNAWNLILALDYKPIFETARAALLACTPDPAISAAIQATAGAALAVSENIASLRHDLLGRIFHTVLDSARYDGSFYTTTPAATLLATLAITDDMCDWQDPEAIAKLRITDPACGTGTLLMAAAERIRDVAPRARDDEDLAAALIEQVLTGYDVNLTATHMAATTLGLLSPTTKFHNMKIGRAFLGVDDDGKAYLGSLEFLDQQPKLMPWPNAAQAVTQVDSGAAMAQAEPSDLVIMNPPFTRIDLRHDQFSNADELALRQRELDLFKRKPVNLAHSGGAFLYLADFLTKSESATIAAVLPLVGATNFSTMDIRKFLAQRFHIETIVTSHDPDRIFFSENTNIGEMLLIGRRRNSPHEPCPSTVVVNLCRNPSTPAEAFNVANAIQNNQIESKGVGTVQYWPRSKVEEGTWTAVQFFSPFLTRSFNSIWESNYFPSTRLDSISFIGPEGRRVRDAFTRSNMPNEENQVALWQIDTAKTQTMLTQPDSYLAIKEKKSKLAEKYWSERSSFLLPHRLFLPTARVTAVRTTTPVLGSLWAPCRLKGDKAEAAKLGKALCAYFNSSIGTLSILGDRTNRKPTYPQFSLDDLRRLLVPNFFVLGEGVVQQLAANYDKYAESVMLPLPQMNHCPVRISLDEAVAEALGIDEETIATIRRQLSMEPSITGKRYAGPGG